MLHCNARFAVTVTVTVRGNTMAPGFLKTGNKYNWIGDEERLIYLGDNFSGNGYWHQFAKVESPNKVWCEVKGCDLYMFEETKE